MSFAERDLTQDGFLDGRLSIAQPAQGYRAGVDPVLLAASVPARPGQSVLELGCGAGVAGLCLGIRIAGLALTGVEIQADYAELARRNADANSLSLKAHTCDLRHLPPELGARGFDHVIANPPYFRRRTGTAAKQPGRDLALAGDTALSDWIAVAARRLAPKGCLSVIQDIRRMPEVLSATQACALGSAEALPIAARAGRAPHLVLIRARKGGRGQFVLHFPLIMHTGDRHERDSDSYTDEIRQVLRNGQALNFPAARARG